MPSNDAGDFQTRCTSAHSIGGVRGGILLGFLAELCVDAVSHKGLVASGVVFLGKQIAAPLLVALYSIVVPWPLLNFLNLFEPNRIDSSLEAASLDIDLVAVES